MKKLKLRYYLRGLGIGILVTALILGIAGGDEGEMTDAQIRERALELGMVESGSIMLSDLRENDTEESEAATVEEEPAESESVESAPTQESVEPTESIADESAESTDSTKESTEGTEDIQEADTSAEESNEEETSTEGIIENEEIPEVVTITVHSGANSYTVSKDLEEAGLVEDAGDFDDYLCDMGYSKIVLTGTYQITVGTSEEEIAKIITGKR